jgi:hypothetical protein
MLRGRSRGRLGGRALAARARARFGLRSRSRARYRSILGRLVSRAPAPHQRGRRRAREWVCVAVMRHFCKLFDEKAAGSRPA